MGEVYDEHNRGGKYTESFGQIPERKGELTRPMCRWKDNIKIILDKQKKEGYDVD
jgi:hypothetical protein